MKDHDLAARDQKRYRTDMKAFLRRLAMKDDRLTLKEHLQGIANFYRWQQKMLTVPRLPDSHTGAFTAYVSGYLRPQNTRALVESLLRTPSVGRVIVSENKPSCLKRWWTADSPRVTFLQHAEEQNCHQRFLHLMHVPSDFFLMTDDDIFLRPDQLEQLCKALKKQPSSPKGICGQRWDGTVLHSNLRSMGEVDVLNRLYVFTKNHLSSYVALSKKLSVDSSWENHGADDIILSYSGSGRPHIVDIGDCVDCTSQGQAGTAQWRGASFMKDRNAAFAKILRDHTRS